MGEPTLPLLMREAVNVDDLKERDKLVRRLRKARAEVVLDLNTWEHWNRTHPDQTPIDTTFERAMIAYYDGEGPMPAIPDSEGGL